MLSVNSKKRSNLQVHKLLKSHKIPISKLEARK